MKSNVGIVAPTPGTRLGESGHIDTDMMVRTFSNFHDEIHIFTRTTFKSNFRSPCVHLHKFHKPFANEEKLLKRVLGFFIFQYRLMNGIIDVHKRRRLDLIILGGWGLIIPLFICRILDIKSVQRVGGHPVKVEKGRIKEKSLFSHLRLVVANVLARFGYILSSYIAVITPKMINFNNLETFKDKILVWNHYFLDFERFRPISDFDKRENVIGFIGVVNEDKGVPELIDAIIKIATININLKFLIVGDGPYLPMAKRKILSTNLLDRVEFVGYVQRAQIPHQINRMKLIVLPSKHEGLPKVILEAMACGTPVLITPVGGITDIIRDGETGFILKNNSPESLVHGIKRCLNHPKLPKIIENALNLEKNIYSYDLAISNYELLLNKLNFA